MTPSQFDPMDLSARVDTGFAELVADPHAPNNWTLIVNDVSQSHVDIGDPSHLDMIYHRLVAAVLDGAAPSGKPLRMLHLGAGAMTLPRYVAATRPGSAQLVVELDRALIEFVGFAIPLPPDSGVTVLNTDARVAIADEATDAFDVIVNDVYRGATMPNRVGDSDFVAQAARVLAPGGVYITNVLDAAGLVLTKRRLATIRTAFADTALLSTPQMWKGRRDGNVVIAAAAEPAGLPLERIAAYARPRLNLALKHGEDLDRFLAGTAPITG